MWSGVRVCMKRRLPKLKKWLAKRRRESQKTRPSQSPSVIEHSEEWHARRRQGLGGSDVAKLFGLSKYGTAPMLWMEKTGRYFPRSKTPQAVLDRGHLLEDPLIARFRQYTKFDVKPGAHFRHADFERNRMQANLDSLITGKGGQPFRGGQHGLLECKTASENSEAASFFKRGRMPWSYMLQVEHYMATGCLEFGYLAAVIGPNDSRRWTPYVMDACYKRVVIEFRPNPLVRKIIEEVAEEFWHEHVVIGVKPSWSEHARSAELRDALLKTKVKARTPVYQGSYRHFWG